MEEASGGERVSRRDVVLGSAGMLAVPVGRALGGPGARVVRARSKLDLEAFVADCVAAGASSSPQEAVREVLARGVHEPSAMRTAVGEPREAGLNVLHRSPTLTVFAATWTPLMNLMPHNHRMWALIGIYAGREDNILWRRTDTRLEAFGAKCLFEGDVAALPDTAIHSVTNPLERYTGGIHIYGGDFFATERSQWNPESLAEEPSNGDVIRAIFERANERMRHLEGR
jgi:predicted metal-dependent enzyme (double-stranded beta helix superfamily)